MPSLCKRCGFLFCWRFGSFFFIWYRSQTVRLYLYCMILFSDLSRSVLIRSFLTWSHAVSFRIRSNHFSVYALICQSARTPALSRSLMLCWFCQVVLTIWKWLPFGNYCTYQAYPLSHAILRVRHFLLSSKCALSADSSSLQLPSIYDDLNQFWQRSFLQETFTPPHIES